MKHFTIDAENHITIHASRKAAKETGSPVFSNEVQFADLIGPDNRRLLKIWNRLPGALAVTRFANRKAATVRIWNAIQEWGGPAAAKPGPEPDLGATQATTARVEVLAAQPAAETTAPPPISHTAPQAASLPAAVSVADQPGIVPQVSATVRAPAPGVAPPSAKANKKTTRTPKPVGILRRCANFRRPHDSSMLVHRGGKPSAGSALIALQPSQASGDSPLGGRNASAGGFSLVVLISLPCWPARHCRGGLLCFWRSSDAGGRQHGRARRRF
jgi:hypothetical protein